MYKDRHTHVFWLLFRFFKKSAFSVFFWFARQKGRGKKEGIEGRRKEKKTRKKRELARARCVSVNKRSSRRSVDRKIEYSWSSSSSSSSSFEQKPSIVLCANQPSISLSIDFQLKSILSGQVRSTQICSSFSS